MSNAIAQSATQLTVAGNGNAGKEWTKETFMECINRFAYLQSKGIRIEGHMLNKVKIVNHVYAEWKSHNPQLVVKVELGAGKVGSRVPDDVVALVDVCVHEYINSKLTLINPDNVIRHNKSWHYRQDEKDVVEKEQLTAINTVDLKKQLIGFNALISHAKDRIRKLESEPIPKYDLEKVWKQKLADYEVGHDNTRAQLIALGILKADVVEEIQKMDTNGYKMS